MSTITVPTGFSYVAASLVSTVVLLRYQAYSVSKSRKIAGIEYPQLYAEKSEMAASPAAVAFNCSQRAHQNTLEDIAQIYIMTVVLGLKHPIPAASALGLWVVGRFAYTIGTLEPTSVAFKREPLRGELGQTRILAFEHHALQPRDQCAIHDVPPGRDHFRKGGGGRHHVFALDAEDAEARQGGGAPAGSYVKRWKNGASRRRWLSTSNISRAGTCVIISRSVSSLRGMSSIRVETRGARSEEIVFERGVVGFGEGRGRRNANSFKGRAIVHTYNCKRFMLIMGTVKEELGKRRLRRLVCGHVRSPCHRGRTLFCPSLTSHEITAWSECREGAAEIPTNPKDHFTGCSMAPQGSSSRSRLRLPLDVYSTAKYVTEDLPAFWVSTVAVAAIFGPRLGFPARLPALYQAVITAD
ncbi:hypothetical protein DFH07DRAFT_1036137 [Mycena maculata]|uniref:Glutathione S-transferase n=1 Tax=Mycena maculata TaxID=230809 RepID=A0AAD7K610_9AGAR|nr:hypothetical protein DFH07DRAFT_1036137 [Mycena maculata]